MSKNVVFLSTYPPKECGIATFTEDLIKNLKANYPINSYKIIAIDDKKYDYNDDVLCSIDQFKREDYKKISEKINNSNVDLVVIEHEYGIYGGNTGEYILDFVKNLKVPFITTLHTTLSKPDEKQKSILYNLGKKSKKIIIMAQNSVKILEDVYSIPKEKVEVIPHGVPDIKVDDKEYLKEKAGYTGKNIVSTFGLLGPGKGIEYAIEAIGKVAKRHPEVLYLILGKTHPCVKRDQGESYRNSLKDSVKRLKIENNVKFINKYLTKKEIVNYLTMSDIYMTPYLGEEQSVSGTLAYAAGYGKTIVSTPYRYAREILKDKKGMLAKFKDSNSLYEAIEFLLDNPYERKIMEKKMLEIGEKMKWPNIASTYDNLFSQIIKKNEYTKQVV